MSSSLQVALATAGVERSNYKKQTTFNYITNDIREENQRYLQLVETAKEAKRKREADLPEEVTYEEFKLLLSWFDDTYQYSDDIEVWRRGNEFEKFLRKVVANNKDCDLIWTQHGPGLSPIVIQKPKSFELYRLYGLAIGDVDMKLLRRMESVLRKLKEISDTAIENGCKRQILLSHMAPKFDRTVVKGESVNLRIHTLLLPNRIEKGTWCVGQNIESFIERAQYEPNDIGDGCINYSMPSVLGKDDPVRFSITPDRFGKKVLRLGCLDLRLEKTERKSKNVSNKTNIDAEATIETC